MRRRLPTCGELSFHRVPRFAPGSAFPLYDPAPLLSMEPCHRGYARARARTYRDVRAHLCTR